jgi:hypothetical protein
MLFSIAGQFESALTASGTLLLATQPGGTHRCIGSATLTWHAVPLRLVPTPTPPPPPTSAAPPADTPQPAAAPGDTADGTPRPTRTAPAATAAPDTTATPTSTPVAPRQVPPSSEPEPTNTTAPTSTPEPAPPQTGDVCSRAASAADAPETPLRLVEISKKSEIVTLENVSNNDIDLSDWTLCSLSGGERHGGFDGVIIEAGDTRRLLHSGNRIWDTEGSDDGALYDPDGTLISFWDDPS